ncbi:carboxypeptidase B-like [Phlebotomus papatasi]|uniref:carboxypeptidase B-like n=1 Tax=Phlebotomus papatasi TaxID=29031 RepID=UPI002483D395|nr:carboxypeptidase B-like [Phlebotomus papatasi]
MRFVFYLLFIFLPITECQQQYYGHRVISIRTDDPEILDMLVKWQNEGIDFWSKINKVGRPITVRIPPILSKDFLDFLQSNDVPFDDIIPNLGNVMVTEEMTQNIARESRRENTEGEYEVEFTYYWDTDEIGQFLAYLKGDYPERLIVTSGGKSYEGRDIYVVKISNTNFEGKKPKVFIDAGIHAREWIAPMVALYLIHQLVVNATEHAELLAFDWIIIPCVNPDGYQYSHDYNRLWRKTRSVNKDNHCVGVDGNRNYGYRWGYGSPDSVNIDPCSETYLGPDPFSESETRTVANVMAQEIYNLELYISFHSYGGWILYPFAFDNRVPHPNKKEVDLLGNMVADVIYKATGRNYTVGNTATLLYPASGGSDDNAAGNFDVDFTYTIELPGGGKHGFDLPGDQIVKVSEEIMIGMKVFLNYILTT